MKEYRARLGLTQEKLAEIVGVHHIQVGIADGYPQDYDLGICYS
ncbi:helix-turn-helix domain-containing protein [Chloroflexota bacterium]